jgi:hypothetical protein
LRVNSSRRKRRGRLAGKGATGFMVKIVPEVPADAKACLTCSVAQATRPPTAHHVCVINIKSPIKNKIQAC